VRDPNPAAHALAHLREYLGQLKRSGFLADPSERRLSDEALDYLLSLVFEKTALAPNRGRPSNRIRDHYITHAVATGAGYGFTPTRSPAAEQAEFYRMCEEALERVKELERVREK
jgi:hypothetical protein